MYRSTADFVLLLAKETAVTKYTTTASNAHAQALITMHTTRRAMGRRARVTADPRSISYSSLHSYSASRRCRRASPPPSPPPSLPPARRNF